MLFAFRKIFLLQSESFIFRWYQMTVLLFFCGHMEGKFKYFNEWNFVIWTFLSLFSLLSFQKCLLPYAIKFSSQVLFPNGFSNSLRKPSIIPVIFKSWRLSYKNIYFSLKAFHKKLIALSNGIYRNQITTEFGSHD